MHKSRLRSLLPYNYTQIKLSQFDFTLFEDSSDKISVQRDKAVVRSMRCVYYKPICKCIKKQVYEKQKV